MTWKRKSQNVDKNRHRPSAVYTFRCGWCQRTETNIPGIWITFGNSTSIFINKLQMKTALQVANPNIPIEFDVRFGKKWVKKINTYLLVDSLKTANPWKMWIPGTIQHFLVVGASILRRGCIRFPFSFIIILFFSRLSYGGLGSNANGCVYVLMFILPCGSHRQSLNTYLLFLKKQRNGFNFFKSDLSTTIPESNAAFSSLSFVTHTLPQHRYFFFRNSDFLGFSGPFCKQKITNKIKHLDCNGLYYTYPVSGSKSSGHFAYSSCRISPTILKLEKFRNSKIYS